MIRRLLFVIGILSLPARAEFGFHGGWIPNEFLPPSSQACSFDALTDHCRLFDPKTTGPLLKIGPALVANFSYLRHQGQGKTREEWEDHVRKDEAKHQERELAFRERMFQILTQSGKEKAAFPFLAYVTSNRMGSEGIHLVLRPVFLESAQQSDSNRILTLPWPPEDPQAKVRSLPLTEVRARLLALVGNRADEVRRLLRTHIAETQQALTSTEGTERLQQVSAVRQGEVAALFEFVKRRTIALITRGRAISVLGESERQALAKIERVSLEKLSRSRNTLQCGIGGPMPAAGFQSIGLKLEACAPVYHLPDENVVALLSRALSQAVGPCLSQVPLYQLDRGKFQGLPEEARKTEEVQKLHAFLENVAGFGRHGGEGTDVFSVNVESHFGKASVQEFIRLGVLEMKSGGSPFSNYFLKGVYQCLTTAAGGGFRGFSVQEIRTLAENLTKEKTLETGGGDPKGQQQRMFESLIQFPECESIGRSEMPRAISDWVSGEVLGAFVQERRRSGKRYDSPLDRLSLIASQASMICDRHRAAPGLDEITAGDLMGDHSADSRGGPHESRYRIDQVILRNPALREALGCSAGPPQCSATNQGGTP